MITGLLIVPRKRKQNVHLRRARGVTLLGFVIIFLDLMSCLFGKHLLASCQYLPCIYTYNSDVRLHPFERIIYQEAYGNFGYPHTLTTEYIFLFFAF